MAFDKEILPKVMQAILAHTRDVLDSEAVIGVDGAATFDCDAKKLELHDITAIAGLGGPVSLLIAFSFEGRLLDAIFRRMTEDIVVGDEEKTLYIRDTAAEITNTVLGLCTHELQSIEAAISLSPPVVVEDARYIQRPANAVFASMKIQTEHGFLDVSIVGPRELFDAHMNYTA